MTGFLSVKQKSKKEIIYKSSNSARIMFSSVGNMKAGLMVDGESITPSQIDLNDVSVSTQGYYGGWLNGREPKGGADYTLTTLQRVRDSKNDQAWVPDGVVNVYLFGGATYVAMAAPHGEIMVLTGSAETINAAIEALRNSGGGKLQLLDGITYNVDRPILVGSGIDIDANKANLVPTNSGYAVIQTHLDIDSSIEESISVIEGSESFVIPAGFQVREGDIVKLSNTVNERIPGYYNGWLGQVVEINAGVAKLSHKAQASFMADTIISKEPFDGVLKNVNINARNITDAQGIVGYTSGADVSNNVLIGSDDEEGLVAVSLTGINSIVENNIIANFFDKSYVSSRLGYGIELNGHNMVASRNNIKQCKHCVTGGTDRYMLSEKVRFESNEIKQEGGFAVVGTTAPVDFHSNVLKGVVKCNTIFGVSAMAQIQNSSVDIVDNEYEQTVETDYPVAIYMVSENKNNVNIRNNKMKIDGSLGGTMIGAFNEFKNLDWHDFKVINNTVDGAGLRIEDHTGDITGFTVFGNSITSNAVGIQFECTGTVDDVAFENNPNISYGNGNFGYAATFKTTNAVKPIIVRTNTFKRGANGSGVYSILIESGSDGEVIPTNNIVDIKIGDKSGLYKYKWFGNYLTNLSATSWHEYKAGTEFKNYKIIANEAPLSGSWPFGTRVYNKNASGGEYEGWVNVAAGSPGTWKGFGLIEA